MAYIRQVKTKSGATAVQVVQKAYGRIVDLTHIGSAHTPAQLDTLMVLARKRLYQHQPALFPEPREPFKLQLKESSSRLLWQALLDQYQKLGFDQLGDEVFASLVVARLVEPVSKLDSLRVMADLGLPPVAKNRLYRCLSRAAGKNYRNTISRACFWLFPDATPWSDHSRHSDTAAYQYWFCPSGPSANYGSCHRPI